MHCFIHLSEQAQAIDGTTDIFLYEYLAAKYLLVNKSRDLLCVIVNESVHLCVCERERETGSAAKGLELNFTSLMQNTAIWEQIYILSTENQNNNDELLFPLRMGCFDASLKEKSESFSAWRWGDEYSMSQQVPCTRFELL